jgi:preprotein translocase subunit SecY
MLKFITERFAFLNNFFSSPKGRTSPNEKIYLTLLVLVLFRFANHIPLAGIDQDALKKAFSQFDTRNSLMQVINMYSGGGGATLLSAFSLGIIPFINASILIDLLTALVPSLEKLQREEGEMGRRRILLYKKLLTLIFAVGQSVILIFYIKPYIYNSTFFTFALISLQLVTGSLIIVWLTSIIDNKGIGNGTSIIIFTNIVQTLVGKNVLNSVNFSFYSAIEILILGVLLALISISQTARFNIEIVSARQLTFLEKAESENQNINNKYATGVKQLKENGLSIRLNQAGIFPIIIASNILPFLSYLTQSLQQNSSFGFLNNVIYYLLIVGFNYFYTIVFWDPEKISEQLRKASVSLINVTPGNETVLYLENIVRGTSILGGIALSSILVLFDVLKQVINGPLLNQLNISSLIIVVGVAYDVQRKIRSLYKTRSYSIT